MNFRLLDFTKWQYNHSHSFIAYVNNNLCSFNIKRIN